MANIDFRPNPVAHAPSAFGFGFGLRSSPSTLQHTQAPHLQSPTHHPPPPPPSHFATPFGQTFVNQAAGHQGSPLRSAHKRRYEQDSDEEGEDGENRQGRSASRRGNSSGGADSLMQGRSPTPERPRRGLKRIRIGQQDDAANKGGKGNSDAQGKSSEDDVDVGVLLASIPPQSHRQILTSLLNAQPALKSLILQLIPRPTLETAIAALAESAKKLKDAYPYSHNPYQTPSTSSSTFGSTSFGFGATTSSSFGFGATSSPARGSGFGSARQNVPIGGSTGMRDSYILSRLRPALQEFIATAQSYLPYFSMAPAPSTAASSVMSSARDSSAPSFIRTQQQQPHQQTAASSTEVPNPEKAHPTESFLFLAHLTSHIISFPAILSTPQPSQSGSTSSHSTVLTEHLIPRLLQEWRAWTDHIDRTVNQEGGMFSLDVVRGWEKSLDEFAGGSFSGSNSGVGAGAFGAGGFAVSGFTQTLPQGSGGLPGMKEIHDRWLSRVGWLLGRTQPARIPNPSGGTAMDEEEEL